MNDLIATNEAGKAGNYAVSTRFVKVQFSLRFFSGHLHINTDRAASNLILELDAGESSGIESMALISVGRIKYRTWKPSY